MEENLKKKKSNIKKIILGSIIGILIGSILGTTYAMFTYNRTGLNNKLIVGDIYMRYKETSQSINFTNAMPTNTYVANQYFEFDIVGKNTNTTKDIIYDIVLAYGDNHETRNTRIRDDLLRFRLVTVDNNVETEIFNNKKYNIINNTRIHATTIPKNTTNETTTTYRLYAWISDETVIGNVNQDYTETEWNDVYASIKVNVTGDFTEKEVGTTLKRKIQELSTTTNYVKNYTTDYINNSSYTYNGERFDTQDTYQNRTREEKQDVYYFTGEEAKENGNVLFAGYCWQIIRTTDTGGIKLIYNGVAENNQCKTDRTAGKGINAKENYIDIDDMLTNVSSITNFGTGYTYDLDAGTFTLTGTNELSGKTWASNSSELIGTYACSDNSMTCSELWYIGHHQHYQYTTSASVGKYVIGNVAHYSQVGTSYYNGYPNSPALVGYMYNKAYTYQIGAKTGNHYANSVTYSNGTYTLVNPTSDVASAPSVGYKYVCNDEEVINGDVITCSTPKVRYYLYVSGTYYGYVFLENGDINPVYVMLNGKTQGETNDANINVYNSAIKGYLDNWYKKNIVGTGAEGKIDTSAVYCNDRSSSNTYGSWNKDATSTTTYLNFKQYSEIKDLKCENTTDRFTAESSNASAKLTYPVGLLTEPESGLMNTGYTVTGQYYWTLSPYYFDDGVARLQGISSSGSYYYSNVGAAFGARPVVSLRPDAEIDEGEGTYENPYVIGDKITR